jgi:hypothetical protein
MDRIAERIASGLPAEELEDSSRIEELKHHREVVLHDLVVEHRAASQARDRYGLSTGELGEQAGATQGERVRGRSGRATEDSELTVTDQALEDRCHVAGRAACERGDLMRREELVLGYRLEEFREPRRLGNEERWLLHRCGREDEAK